MALYRDLARSNGVPEDRILMTEIGSLIEFEDGKGGVRGRVPSGSVFVDRLGDFELGKVKLRTRDDLASDGLVTISILVDAENGKLIAGPEFVTKGLSMEALAGPIREAEKELKRSVGAPSGGGAGDGLPRLTGQGHHGALAPKTKQRPLILPIVLEL